MSRKSDNSEDRRVRVDDADYPRRLLDRLGSEAPETLWVQGDSSLLRRRGIGLVCSVRCPGSVVMPTFEAIRAMRDEDRMVIGGFHSPMEKECLDILLRGRQPIVFCAARAIRGLRIGRDARKTVDEGRLLVVSPFAEDVRRTTAATATTRNEVVAALSESVFVPYASPGGKAEALVRRAIKRGQRLLTLDDENDATLVSLGAEKLPRAEWDVGAHLQG